MRQQTEFPLNLIVGESSHELLLVPVGRAEPVVHFLLKRLHHLLRLRENTLVLSLHQPHGERRSHADQGFAMLGLFRINQIMDLVWIVDSIEDFVDEQLDLLYRRYIYQRKKKGS